MFVVYWISLLTLQTTLMGSNADIIISEDGTSKWLYHEKSKQIFSIGNSTPDALFGYSIAYQGDIHSLIVGSPHESQIGKVYKCAIEDKSTECDALISPVGLEHPHNLWLGANVNAGPSFLMACAPRTVKHNGAGFTGVYGSCFYQNDWRQNNLKAMISIRPDDNVRKSYHDKVYHGIEQILTPEILSDTFGWSSYVTDEGNIFVGGPAMSVGRTMVYAGVTQTPHLITVDNQKLQDERVAFNFGYSITAGHFMLDSELMFAISSPYGTLGYGGVYFYTYSGSESDYVMKDVVLEGPQVGSLFGAALCSFDQGNGLSALLVGAPAYAPSAIKSYDIGVVYVYNFDDSDYGEELFAADPIREVLGHSNGGYFGAAIVSVGDFDGDGIDEVAIGAPYEHNGRGAVYIYSGEQLLTLEDPELEQGKQLYLQRILPQDSPLNQYFGWSLSAPSDSDNNGCKELAIGAPGGNHVTLLRCMASVNVSFDVEFPDLKEQIKTLSAKDALFSFKTCLNVTYPEKPNPKTLETEIAFEVKNVHKNVKILGADSNGVRTFKIPLATSKTLICETIQVQLPKDADYDNNITFKTTARLQRNQDPIQSTRFNPRLVLLNGRTSLSENHTITPKIPGSQLSFEMHTSLKDGYILGSTINETLTFSMLSSGSTAHGACVRAKINGVSIAGLPPRICSYSGGKLRCIKDILKKGDSWNVTVIMDTKQMTSANEKVDIHAELWTSDCSKPTGKNLTRVLELITDNNLNVTGYATEVKVTREELQSVRGKSFEHIYTVINFGLTTWSNLRCEVSLPSGVLKSAVYVVYDESTSKNCAVNDANHTATCKIKETKPNSPIHIRVQMDIGPNDPITAQILKGKTTSIDTSLTLALKKGDIREKKLSNKIAITESPRAPLWIFIVAGLVGLLIVVLICWALHECGFLRRDTKKKLDELKENVKRQSMRRSAMLRLSRIEMPKNQDGQSDQRRLVELPEEESGSPDALTSQDPARAAFEAELARALSKDKNTRAGERH